MPLKIRENYVNPLTMMGQKKNGLTMKRTIAEKQNEKTDTLQNLQNEKQAVQNKMLLVKTTSDSGAVPEETQKAMDKQLEEISSQIKAMEAQSIQTASQTSEVNKLRFDRFVKSTEKSEHLSMGIYSPTYDEKGKVQLLWNFEDKKRPGRHIGAQPDYESLNIYH